jgi:hypothetical protein
MQTYCSSSWQQHALNGDPHILRCAQHPGRVQAEKQSSSVKQSSSQMSHSVLIHVRNVAAW